MAKLNTAFGRALARLFGVTDQDLLDYTAQDSVQTIPLGRSAWHQELSDTLIDLLDGYAPEDEETPFLELDTLIPESDMSALVLLSDRALVDPLTCAFRVAATEEFQFAVTPIDDPRKMKPAREMKTPPNGFDLVDFIKGRAREYQQKTGFLPEGLEEGGEEDVMSLPSLVPPSKFEMN
jgi:hypothetical protein